MAGSLPLRAEVREPIPVAIGHAHAWIGAAALGRTRHSTEADFQQLHGGMRLHLAMEADVY
jgi:hypothetical protein